MRFYTERWGAQNSNNRPLGFIKFRSEAYMHFNIWPRCIWSSNEPIYVLCVCVCVSGECASGWKGMAKEIIDIIIVASG